MTDQKPDRQDGDGLLDTLKAIASECQRWRDEQPTTDGASKGWALHLQGIAESAIAASPTRDGVEGAGKGHKFNPLDASPPVREDREAIAPKAIAEAFSDWAWNKKDEAVGNMLAHEAAKVSFFAGARWAGTPRLSQDTLDRLAALNVSEEEIKDALAKAYALYRWKAKLEDLSDDMKDDCYGFAESVHSGENSER